MQHHMFSRGLAASAVAALAVTGLATFSTAHADNPSAVTLLSQFTSKASTRQDADGAMNSSTSTTITLTAAVADPTSTAAFQYNPDPDATDTSDGWTDIVTAQTPTNGYVTFEWAPPGLAGQTIALRAAVTAADGVTTTYSTRNDVAISDGTSDVNAVRLTNTSQGYFTQPYADSGHTATLAAVAGSTSATDGNVALSWWNAADGTFQGQTNAAVTPTSFKLANQPYSTNTIEGGTFAGALDISAFDAQSGDVLPIAAERDSDAVVPVTLQSQTINSIYASFPHPSTSKSEDTVLTVLDQNGQPIAGAEVRRESDGALVGYTDGLGDVTATQTPGSTVSYYANATDADGYDPADGDVATDATAPDYIPIATSVKARLADGAAFDAHEYAAGDVALQVLDQEGSPYTTQPGAEVTYAVYPKGGSAGATATGTTDSAGRIVVPFDPSTAGSYTLAYSNPGKTALAHTTTFTVGDSTLALTPGKGWQLSGGRITFSGSLTVAGKPMAGRQISLKYARGTELAPGSGADAGIGSARRLTATVTTNADGRFSVTVQDRHETIYPAESGTLTARTADNVASASSTVSGNADDTATASAHFVAHRGSAALELTGTSGKGGTDRLTVRTLAGLAGRKVTLYREIGGTWTKVSTAKLGRHGVARFVVADKNGAGTSRYRVTLPGSPLVRRATSNVLTLS